MLLIVSVGISLAIAALAWLTSRGGFSRYALKPVVLLVGAVAALGVTFATVAIGGAVAKADAVTYNEWWGGYETGATVTTTTCTRDGSCVHEYDCDSYTEIEYYTDSDGEQQTRWVTKWHSCPYVDVEYSYNVQSEVGDFSIASHIFAENPTPWRAGKPVPGNIPRGVPAEWQETRDRLDAGQPGGRTARHTYKNYILASQSTILKANSASMEDYLQQGLLPKVASEYQGGHLYTAKAYGVNYQVSKDMLDAVMRFNAAFGDEAHGDLHLVITSGIDDPDRYTGALNAYWQSKDLGKDAASKNTLVVVVGTDDGKTVSWARAFTGMPKGNEELLQDVKTNLVGVSLEPDKLLGAPRGVIDGDDVTVEHTDGALENIVWGPHAFVRVSMSGDDGTVGFSYLAADVRPSAGAQIMIAVVAIVLNIIIWGGAFVYYDSRSYLESERYDTRSYRSRSGYSRF